MNALTNRATRLAVSATGLRKAYGTKVVLDGVDLSIGQGEVFALLGSNGAGKTTAVKILSTEAIVSTFALTIDRAKARSGSGYWTRPTASAIRSAACAPTLTMTSLTCRWSRWGC